ncbi:MAG TPA: DNA translocase FtsK [Candidatus Limnocylindria bacterium]|nr:DNA translocase FtsK [Candidatus Limnocylindria bacterium]
MPTLHLPPEVVRSLVGLTLLVLGIVTLIMLLLPAEQGTLTNWARTVVLPNFGSGRWLLPFFLLGAGGLIEWRPLGSGWQARLIAAFVAYAAFLGLLEFLPVRGGGRIGTFLADVLASLVTRPGAFVVLAAVLIGGILIVANARLAELVASLRRAAGGLGTALAGPPAAADAADRTGARQPRPGRAPAEPRNGPEPPDGSRRSPAPIPSEVPMSQTVVWGAAHSAPGGPRLGPERRSAGAPASASVESSVDLLEAEDASPPHARPWVLPPIDLLSARAEGPVGRPDHATNIGIIEDKLRSFGIPAMVIGTNTGPVVTQYEVRPEPHIKLSRIEGLADDLAMALAARSIRIEAPIPGKDVVGIEIPNVKSEVVGFRRLMDDTKMLDAESRLSFALGRDVSGKAYAVDLAKMPHLLVAGATGSGKSVCINALITSLLMHAKPEEVRLILIDLKRVELGGYDRLPHLLTPVINEPRDAKSALDWAVHQMEERYKALAAKTARNIATFNASERVAPEERLPYVVIVIDELADLIMREGRKVEEPVVKIAQKARAVGIHLVLATQRPSVNVVTGLIKANVPSRIAFAMASMIDSRTVLDAPGAEDLIGRGDMLYQPVDLPRPIRLQGVFVSDDEVRAVTGHWIEQAPEPLYDPDVLAYVDTDGNGSSQFSWLAAMAEDDMVVQAAELVTTLGKASTSMLQTKLKVGFSRASRLMDELERYGIIGPQDPRNPAVPRIVYGRDNWLVSHADIDNPGH